MPHEVSLALATKVVDLWWKGCIAGHEKVRSDMDSFAVPKVVRENCVIAVRLVWNGESLGLNDTLCAPNFGLPTSETATRQLSFNCKSCNFDIGKMFLNFPLPAAMQPCVGVRAKEICLELDRLCPTKSPLQEAWTHLAFSLGPSPCGATKHRLHARSSPSEIAGSQGVPSVGT